MKIAITYNNGMLNEHYGKSTHFKFYEIEDNKIVNSYVLPTNCGGHNALASFLVSNKTDVVICGGMGMPAYKALVDNNIKVYSGNKGFVDKLIIMYLNNTLNDNNSGVHDHGCHHECE